jgi:hypothetical protein
MTPLHKLFNPDDPICLYCNSECDVNGFGEAMAVVDTYTCRQCKEEFEIFSVGEIRGFNFTCNGISVHHNYPTNQFGIKRITKEKSSLDLVWLPEFEVNFSEKEKLHRRLLTYLIFS